MPETTDRATVTDAALERRLKRLGLIKRDDEWTLADCSVRWRKQLGGLLVAIIEPRDGSIKFSDGTSSTVLL